MSRVSIPSSRAVSPVIGTIIIVAIVVVLAATVSIFALGFTDDINQPGPLVTQSSGELVSGGSDQIVRLTAYRRRHA
ncbi:MAG: archaellin/type IV pilin N-terminal domain-containing protein [Halobacteriales archaeon]|nr:archaellin/type IV pilin N-terminal domain-containing protein [Halobacteriales archaeon]